MHNRIFSPCNVLQIVANSFRIQHWRKLLKAFLHAGANADRKLRDRMANPGVAGDNYEQSLLLSSKWNDLISQCKKMEANIGRIENGFAFARMDGLLVQAMKQGHWLLLDEINLASSETLQVLIVGMLDIFIL